MAAETLMEKEVWVSVEGADTAPRMAGGAPATERALTLTLQLLEQPGGGKDIGIRLTDEADPFFLYALQLSLEDFSRLRQSQNLKVDFTAFPSNVVALVDRCGRRGGDSAYVLELNTAVDGGTLAMLSVVETNPFKNLVHLSLTLIPGTDCTVKKHLANCLLAHKAEELRLRTELEATTTTLASKLEAATAEAAASTSEAVGLKVELETVTHRMTSEHAAELARLRAAAADEMRRVTQNADGATAALESDLRRQLSELTATSSSQAARLIELEGSLRDTRSRLSSAEASAGAAEADLEAARAEIRTLRASAHETEGKLNEGRVRIAELTQEVKGRAELETQQAALTRAATEQKEAAEDATRRLELRCETAEKRGERYGSEIQKGNAIIKRLQRDLATVHAKLEARSSVIVRQEQALGESEKERARLERELGSAHDSLAVQRREVTNGAQTAEQTQAELDETRRLLKNSEGIITWLNKQLTEAKRGRTVEAAVQRVTAGKPAPRLPLAAKTVNIGDANRKVSFTRGKQAPLANKYLEPSEPLKDTSESLERGRSQIPRVTPPVPASAENPSTSA